MQVTETNNSGLKRELKVVVGAGELSERFAGRLDAVKDQIQIKGFRKGKVPVSHIKKVYGRSIMAEVLQQAIDETSKQALTDRKERPAVQPKIDLPEASDEIELVFSGKSDLAYNMSFEVLPEIKLMDFSALALEREVAPVDEAAVDAAVAEIAKRNIAFVAEEGRAAGDGDRATLDFVGSIDGVEFDGGKGEGVPVVLGQGSFIPGFEDGIKGAKAGEQRTVTATFPEAYGVETLKGKTATFKVDIKEVARAEAPALNDDFAKSLGAESLAAMRELVKGQISNEHAQITRQRLKRALLDKLAEAHDFELPASLVDSEFEGVWNQVNEGLKQAGKTLADEGKTEEGAREEYRKIAERRVRLGLVIGECGDKNKIEVTQDELRRVLIEQARRFPGQERMVYEYYEKTPGAIAELRAPIFEDKVVDLILAQAKLTDREISRDELLKPDAT